MMNLKDYKEGFPNYAINSKCEVINIESGRMLKLTPNSNDESPTTLQVRLSKDGVVYKYLLGRLVAELKYGPCPKGLVAGIDESVDGSLWDKFCWTNKRATNGLPSKTINTFSVADATIIADMITTGVSLKAVASCYKVSPYIIKQVCKEMGVPTLGRHTHKNPKIGAEEIREAQALWLSGTNYTTIANRLGISRWCIRRVLRSSFPSSPSGLSDGQ